MISKKLKIFLILTFSVIFSPLFRGKAFADSAKTTAYTDASSSYRYSICKNENWYPSPYTNSDVCNYGSSIAAFASAYSILTNKKITPTEVAKIAYTKNYWPKNGQYQKLQGTAPKTLIKQLASYGKLKYAETSKTDNATLKKVVTLVARGAVVLIRSYSSTAPFNGYSGTPNYVLIYAAKSDGYFKVVSPNYCKVKGEFCGEWLYYKTLRSALGSNTTFYALAYNSLTDSSFGSGSSGGSGSGGSSGGSSGAISNAEALVKKYYMSQCDGAWKNTKFNGSTMCNNGCPATTMAMVLSILYQKKVSPVSVAQSVNCISKNCNDGLSFFSNSASKFKNKFSSALAGLKWQNHKNAGSVSSINSELKQGHIVVFHCKGGQPCAAPGSSTGYSGGHYFAIVGATSSGKWVIANPAGWGFKGGKNSVWSPDAIVKLRKESETISFWRTK